MSIGTILPIVIFGLTFLFALVKVLPEWERAVILRLGRVIDVKGPGLILLIPGIDRLIRVSVRTLVHDIPPQDVITKDNVSLKINAVVYFRAVDPIKAITEVDDYLFAVSQLAQTTLRSVAGQAELDEILVEREQINMKLQEILDSQTDPWGIKVSAVEIKHIDLPEMMQRAMAKQAEAERERRAKVIAADGERQAADQLADAAQILSKYPAALQLRYMQTLSDIATENNSVTVFPIPMELLGAFQAIADTNSSPSLPIPQVNLKPSTPAPAAGSEQG